MESKMKTPNQQVSEAIVRAMVEGELLSSEAEQDLVAKIASGRQTALEWRLLFVEQIEKEAKEPHKEGEAT
jgi:hypothetical protein